MHVHSFLPIFLIFLHFCLPRQFPLQLPATVLQEGPGCAISHERISSRTGVDCCARRAASVASRCSGLARWSSDPCYMRSAQ